MNGFELGDVMGAVWIRDGHGNNWTLLRIVMALAVLVGHALIIGERDLAAEPLVYGRFSISFMAVNAFFIASGFLVTASMMHRRDLVEFTSARVLRIYPALVVHVLIVALVVGLANTTLSPSAYLTSAQVWAQFPKVLAFANTDFLLPGVFESNHEPYASAPLWTLRYEVLAYATTAVAFAVGLMRSRWMLAVPFVAASLAMVTLSFLGIYEELPATLSNCVRFAVPYGLGALFWAYRDELPLRTWALPMIVAAAYLSRDWVVGEIMMNLAVGYAIFWLAYAGRARGASKVSDISYGIYIWHWPILQWMAAQNPAMSTEALVLAALMLTPLVAYASWRWVEKPMLARKGWLAERLKRPRLQPV